MKLSDLKTQICNIFNLLKQWASKNFSKMSKADKIVVIGLIGSLITIFVFVTGKNLPDFFHKGNHESNGANINENNVGNIQINGDVYGDIYGTIYGGENDDENGNESNNNPSLPIDETNTAKPDSIEHTTKSNEKLIMSRPAYIEELYRAIGSDEYMVTDYYTDYNHDGNFEMFAVVTPREKIYYLHKETYAHREEKLPFIFGQIWFVNQDGARNISLTDSHDTTYAFWSVFNILSIGEDKFFACVQPGPFVDEEFYIDEEFFTNEEFYADEVFFSDIVHLWGVTPSGEPYQAELSGHGCDILLNDDNEIELFCSTLDFYYDGCFLGRTWKPYYFYWDGTSFKEYGGTPISIDSLYSISGSKKLLEQVDTELKKIVKDVQISEIYYRENGIININYRCKENDSHYDDYDFDYVNYNVTLRYEDKKLKIVSGESDLFREGMYLPALLPQIAIYPDAAFES